ncbi:ABC transporter ATP-binding protein [Engelhardtia mirabilis]|uniref:Putative ABC transporter ATP-binding protein YxlF n=1 Tax=Engelhardtia mirabilis TaxID=2528011 RepID=A0A518BIK4_9BACT|nr:putative ABC transporter ATP-binding protein YxlF [Planctomycetes bacterium Pla133]QDV01127.1 putative ABC transporter ATP-binding protein YxlF [Planctomycetes bacterium Pla86]
MTAILEVERLTKTFDGLTAVDQISFEVGAGEICGFIGPNGAGKTTTMRICATLELPDEGDVRIGGHSVLEEPRYARHRTGFMPDHFGAYPSTTVEEYIDFFARAQGLRGAKRLSAVGDVTEFTGLSPLLGKAVSGLSKGMRQRLCLAKTLLHDPKLLILDEPASGLDPRARVELRELVVALAELGKAVLISSHILTELSEICTSVAVIELGRIKAHGNLKDIRARLSGAGRAFLRCMESPEQVERAMAELPGIQQLVREQGGVSFDYGGGDEILAGIVTRLVTGGLRPVEVRQESADLEDVFLELTEGQVQ